MQRIFIRGMHQQCFSRVGQSWRGYQCIQDGQAKGAKLHSLCKSKMCSQKVLNTWKSSGRKECHTTTHGVRDPQKDRLEAQGVDGRMLFSPLSAQNIPAEEMVSQTPCLKTKIHLTGTSPEKTGASVSRCFFSASESAKSSVFPSSFVHS